jgi:hypothetical protein
VTRPRRPPVKPGPITDDPTQGQYQVVATFRARVLLQDREGLRLSTERAITNHFAGVEDLTVHVRVIGAGGERSEQEIWPALTEDLAPVRATENIDPGGKL